MLESTDGIPAQANWNCWFHGTVWDTPLYDAGAGEGWRNHGETTTGGTKYCPAGQQARGSWDGHNPASETVGPTDKDFSESECCRRTCWWWRDPGDASSGDIDGAYQCPAMTAARGSSSHSDGYDDQRDCEEACDQSECCQKTCWSSGWRDPGDSSGTNQCPPMTVARGGDDDQHDCEEACDQSECCQKTCWSSGWRDSGDSSGTNQCPVTSNVRRGSDDECGSGGQSGECDQYGCCEPTCGKSGFVDQSSCPSGTELRYDSSSSGKGQYGACSSSLARSSGMCQQADCCRQTCSDAGYKTGGTRSCPTGMAYRTDHHYCESQIFEDPSVMGECSDAECCSVPSSGSGSCWDTGFRDSTAETTQGARHRPCTIPRIVGGATI